MKRSIFIVLLVCACASQSFAQKRVLFICDNGAGTTRGDPNMIALMSTGATIGGTPIPGLGYIVTTVDDGIQGDGDGYVPGSFELIFISETTGSNNVDPHTDKPIGVINGEQALVHNRTDRGSMFFSDGSGARPDENVFRITNNTHPITSLFPLGDLTVFNFAGGEMGVMTGTIATAVTVLAENPNAVGEPCIAVADIGATPFLPGIPLGSDPAPGRRVCLGFHMNGMTNPTVEGAYLFQRAIQWGISDPVTAGQGAQLPQASVTRAVNAPYVPGTQTSIQLTATPLSPTALDLTETLEAGWTVVSATPSAGTATPSGNTVNWTADLTTIDETLTYVIQAPAAACGPSTVTGTFTAVGNGVVQGDGQINQASDGIENAPIPWEASADISPGMAVVGRAEWFACDNPPDGSYLIWGDGNDIWGNADSFHFLYLRVLGDFAMTAQVEQLDPEVNTWEKGGVMARANLTPGSPHVMCIICSGCRSDGASGQPEPHIVAQERVDADGGSQRFDGRPDGTNPDINSRMLNTGPAIVGVSRGGTLVAVHANNLEGDDRSVFWYGADRPNIPTTEPIYVGLAFTSHSSGTIERAHFTNVVFSGNVVADIPNAPSNLTALGFGSDGILLNWTDASNNESGFKIERKEGAGGTYAEIAQTVANMTAYQDTGLNTASTYFYRVRAFNTAGDSAYSNEASAQPGGAVLDATRWILYR